MTQQKRHPLTQVDYSQPIYVSKTGRKFYPIGGADDDPPGAKPSENEDGKATFTQADLNRIAAKEKAEGKAAAERAFAEQLGMSLDDAKAVLKARADAEEKTKSEAQKDREAAQKEKDAAAADRLSAKQEVHDARIERALAKAGAPDEDAKMARLKRLVAAEVGSSYEDILADVEAVKGDFPGLFGEKQDSKPPKAPSGDPPGTPPRPTGGTNKLDAGRERARKRLGIVDTK